MKDYVYVDNSNLFIEESRIQAVKEGLESNIWDAQKNRTNTRWQMDYGRLYEFLCGKESAVARLWGSPPPGDSYWDMVRRKGWEVQIYQKSVKGKEKKVDVDIGFSMAEDAYTRIEKSIDVLTLVAGDADYVPAVERLIRAGFRVEVAFWSHAAKELREAASQFHNIDKYHELITRNP